MSKALKHLNDNQAAWREKSKSQLTETSRVNMLKRLQAIILTVQTTNDLLKDFEIEDNDLKQMFGDVDDSINSWCGVDITSCKKQKKSFKEYKVTATNWFNRNKAKIYGTYFFYPLIFGYILNFCYDLSDKDQSVTDNDRMSLFIDIFLSIFDGKITFARTKAQPLMPYQTLIQPNKFRLKCREFVVHYGLEWNGHHISPSKIHRVYQKDKYRSQKIYLSFIKCLKQIKIKLNDSDNTYSLFKPQNNSNLNKNSFMFDSKSSNRNSFKHNHNDDLSFSSSYSCTFIKEDNPDNDDQDMNDIEDRYNKFNETSININTNNTYINSLALNDNFSPNSTDLDTPITNNINIKQETNSIKKNINISPKDIDNMFANLSNFQFNISDINNFKQNNNINDILNGINVNESGSKSIKNNQNIGNNNNCNMNTNIKNEYNMNGMNGLNGINGMNFQQLFNVNNVHINTVNFNGDYLVNNNYNNNTNNNINNTNGYQVRYRFLSLDPSLPPILINEHIVNKSA